MYESRLVDLECALDDSGIPGKLEIHPIILLVKTFQKCYPPDFKFYPS